jgi:hypothetical protein
MAKKKGKGAGLPARVMLLWSKSEMRRFSETVERLCAAIGQLEVILAEPVRRAEAAAVSRKLKVEMATAARNAIVKNNEPHAPAPSVTNPDYF